MARKKTGRHLTTATEIEQAIPRGPRAACNAGRRLGKTLWRADATPQPASSPEQGSISGGFCVSAYTTRVYKLDVTSCDIKFAPRRPAKTACVAMLSSVLKSPTAVRVNIEIMRTFVKLRRLIATPGELVEQITKPAETVQLHDQDIKLISRVLQQMLERPNPPRRAIGFHAPDKDSPSKLR